jgi:hypothetical protein
VFIDVVKYMDFLGESVGRSVRAVQKGRDYCGES